MKKKLMLVLLSLALLLILTACAQTAEISKQIEAISNAVGPVPTATPAPTVPPKATYIPKVSPTPTPTAKPFYVFAVPTMPPIVEPTPTITPSPTPRPTVTPYVPPTPPPLAKMPESVSFAVTVPTPAPVQTYTAPTAREENGETRQEYTEEETYEEPEEAEEVQEEAPARQSKPVSYGPTGQEVADYACGFVGYNYLYGGQSPETGFDCSGLVYYVYSQFGYNLHRIASSQASDGVAVDPSELQPGDVICFYNNGSYIGHSGIYIGNGKYVHAESSATGVVISPLSGRTYGYECRRIIQ